MEAGNGNESNNAETRANRQQKPPKPGIICRCWRWFWFSNETGEVKFAGWVARFTFLLAIIGIIQAWAFIQSERAFVANSGITFAPETPQSAARISMRFRNSGNSTAFTVHNLYGVAHELPPVPQYGSLTSIPPRPVIRNGEIIANVPVSNIPAEDRVILNGMNIFYVWGRIDYRDEFSVWGWKSTGWCEKYDPTGAPDSGTGLGTFATCDNTKYTLRLLKRRPAAHARTGALSSATSLHLVMVHFRRHASLISEFWADFAFCAGSLRLR